MEIKSTFSFVLFHRTLSVEKIYEDPLKVKLEVFNKEVLGLNPGKVYINILSIYPESFSLVQSTLQPTKILRVSVASEAFPFVKVAAELDFLSPGFSLYLS